MALLLFVGGVGSGLLAGMGLRRVAGSFGRGVLNIAPGIVLILMSTSVKHIVQSGQIMDSLLHSGNGVIEGRPPLVAAFLVYLVTLIMNFFVGSASAKAFLMMPILTPLADLVGITRPAASRNTYLRISRMNDPRTSSAFWLLPPSGTIRSAWTLVGSTNS
jgi:uncharacterized ion transporter superfamily protein YfcC